MTAHRILLNILHNLLQVRDRVVVAGLAEAVGKLVLEQSRARCETSCDRLNGREGLLGRGLQAREVLEGEEGAEAASEGLRFGGEDLAEGQDGLARGGRHFGGREGVNAKSKVVLKGLRAQSF